MKGAADSLPPPTNRGAEMTVGVDWLSFTLKGRSADRVMRLVSHYLRGEFVHLEHGGKRYQRMAVGTGGAKVYWSPGRDDVHAELPGKAIGSLSEPQVRGLVLAASALGKVTRVDVFADDFRHVVQPREVYESVDRAVTHTARDGWEMRESRGGGATCYIGSRSSRQFLRVYNKAAQTGGLVDSIRWELEFKKEVAEYVSARLIRERWQTVFGEHLVQLVDFRDRSEGRRGDRGARLSWYEHIVGAVGKAGMRHPRQARTLEEAEAWIMHQVAPTLATVFESRGGDLDYITALLEDGKRRQKPQHRALLRDELEQSEDI
jgi:hypothetical protein